MTTDMEQMNRAEVSRNQILERIRARLGRTAGQDPSPHRQKIKPVVPKQGRVGGAALVSTFIKRAKAVDATVERVKDTSGAVTEVAHYVSKVGADSVFTSSDSWLASLPWADIPALARQSGTLGQSQADNAVSVTSCVCGIAETGTVMTVSGPTHPVTLNFLASDHIVILGASQIVANYEKAWTCFDEAHPTGRKESRAIHWITGPSRSADIALKPELGAHGPLRLHIIIVDGL